MDIQLKVYENSAVSASPLLWPFPHLHSTSLSSCMRDANNPFLTFAQISQIQLFLYRTMNRTPTADIWVADQLRTSLKSAEELLFIFLTISNLLENTLRRGRPLETVSPSWTKVLESEQRLRKCKKLPQQFNSS